VGKAVEKLFGTGSSDSSAFDISDDDDTSESVTSVFDAVLKMISKTDVSEDTEEEAEEVGVDTILSGISDVIKAGISEKKEPQAVVKAVVQLFSSDDDDDDDDDDVLDDLSEILDEIVDTDADSELFDTEKADNDTDKDDFEIDTKSLADAVMTVLCSLSGIDTSAEDFTLETAGTEITPQAVEALGNISGTLAQTVTNEISADETVDRILDSVQGEKEPETDKDVKFFDYKASDTGVKPDFIQTGHHFKASMRINDVSAQLDAMRNTNGQQSDDESEPDFTAAVSAYSNIPAAKPETVSENIISEDEEVSENVYKELGDIVNVQLSENIVEEVPENGVKELTVVLHPKDLGEVALKLTTDDNGTVKIILAASNPEVGKALNENSAALSEDLAKQNLTVDDILVVNPSEASSYMNLDFTNQGFNRRNDGYENESGSGSYNGRSGSGAINGVDADISAADEVRAQRLLKEAKLWLTA
jgi:flagellar hook-length control protein FliK